MQECDALNDAKRIETAAGHAFEDMLAKLSRQAVSTVQPAALTVGHVRDEGSRKDEDEEQEVTVEDEYRLGFGGSFAHGHGDVATDVATGA